jgi:ParB family transcriptional regulator, chromosome partitioning protein
MTKTPAEVFQIPLNKLIASESNVRKTGGQSIDDLAASIRAHGLLHNLVVAEPTDSNGKYQVVAGGRRFAALKQLAKQKIIPKTYPVACRVVDAGETTETSLAENVIREAMHPADQFAAFRGLIDQGAGIEDVAARFGVAPTVVRQRLKLANVSPRLFESYRAGELALDQLMALAITDDHEAQERVWDGAQEWQRRPNALRTALTESKINAATDARVRFIGVEAYTAAGGHIERDLFQPEHEGYLTDRELLDRLVTEKLETVSESLKAEGWKWVEILPSADYSLFAKFGRIYPVLAPATPEIRAEIEALEAEQEQINYAHEDAREYPPQVEERMSEIEERIDELNEQTKQFNPEEKTIAGAVLWIEHDGRQAIHRGLVRPEDKKNFEKVKMGGNAEDEVDSGDGKEVAAEISAALVEELTAHRTAALRAVLATRPDVALVAVAHNLALQVCYKERCSYKVGSALSLTTEKGGCPLECHAKGIDGSIAQTTLLEVHSKWLKRIPVDPDELWEWLLKQAQSVVIDLLAFCVGQTVHAVRLPHESPTQERFAAADRLADAVNFDMTDWWTATGESYLGRVKKDQILEAISEGTGETNLEELRKLKKAELVATAEQRLAQSRWLPRILKS